MPAGFEEFAKHVPAWGWLSATTIILVAIVAIAGVVIWRLLHEDDFEFFGLRLHTRDDGGQAELQSAIAELDRDDKTKRNVLLCARRLLERLRSTLDYGLSEHEFEGFARDVLDDALAAIGRGGDDYHRASLWIHAEEGSLRMAVGVGFRREAIKHARLHLQRSAAGHVVRTGESINIRDVSQENGYEPKERTSSQNYRSLLIVPVKQRDDAVFAALCVDAQSVGYFTDDDLFYAECLADVLAIAVCCRRGEPNGI